MNGNDTALGITDKLPEALRLVPGKASFFAVDWADRSFNPRIYIRILACSIPSWINTTKHCNLWMNGTFKVMLHWPPAQQHNDC